MINNYHKTITLLIKSAIATEPVNLPDNIDWDKVFEIAENHQITPIIYYGIHNSNLDLSDDVKNRFKQSIYSTAASNEQQDYEISKLFKEFSKNKRY